MSDPPDTFVDDDDYTQIFGVASELGGAALWVGFCSVAAYLLLFGGLLDKLETMTAGTSYHLVLQRIYREIMMVGFCSFTFTILNQTNTELPFGLIKAFGFADICLFAMSSFFCLQGVFIMLASVRQAQNWNVASQIPAEELLHNMSVWELSHPLTWRARYFPFCPTREQVEFRILKSIFAAAYNIKASHAEFDFSIFLRMTHESNIVRIIDISFKHWVYILLLTGFASLKLHFWNSGCSSEECEDQEDIKIFTICGSVYGFLSVVVWLWGRILELRLIKSAGVEGVDDYSIFLMTEFRTEQNLSDCAATPVVVKDVISDFLKEKEVHEIKSKEEKYVRRRVYLKRVAEDVHSEGIGGTLKKRLTVSGSMYQSSPSLHGASQKSLDESSKGLFDFGDVPCVDVEDEESDSESCQIVPQNLSVNAKGQNVTTTVSSIESDPLDLNSPKGDTFAKPIMTSHKSSSTKLSSVGCDDSNEVYDNQNSAESCNRELKNKTSFENKLVGSGMSMIVRRNKKKFLRMTSGVRRFSNFGKKTKRGREYIRRQASNGWRTSVEKLFTRSASKNIELSSKEREQRFSSIVKANFNKQNFKDIFPFKSPKLFYNMISFIITCNSLYLAWWATNFLFVIMKMKYGDWRVKLALTVYSLIPPIVAFPTIFLAIRSSTILKAITLLDLNVVAAVIEKSEVNTNMLAEFRKTILKFMKKQGSGVEGMIKTCNMFAEKDSNVLRKTDFREMLLHNKVIYTPDKIDFLFGSIDLNGGSTVDYGEFETFLFADNNYESDQKRQELFQKMTIHQVKGKGRGNNSAVRILDQLKFENFREKNLVNIE